MTYPKAIQFLYGLQMFGANFGLETTRKLAALAGNPQTKLRFIHVAGTNGKGSTCAMLESIYRAAGLRVGLFTSPHLVSFRERIQVSRQLIAESDVARLVAELQESLKEFAAEQHPTMFEIVTVMALKYFAEQKCDLVIWETGLGGRLDATNIVTPLASVITNIAFDHQQWLGDTLEKIAAEKAGIIKPGVPVVTTATQPEVLAVAEHTAQENRTRLTVVGQASRLFIRRASRPIASNESETLSTWTGGMPVPLLLPGEHQKQNAALALATVEVLQKQIPITEKQIRAGLAGVNWPGRLQFIERGGQKILLDGAHNVAGVQALRAALPGWSSRFSLSGDTLKRERQRGTPTLILGFLGDKDWRPMCEILAPLAANFFIVPVTSPRTADAAEVAAFFRAANPAAEVLACGSLPEALAQAAAETFVVIAGSLYLVGEALALLDPAFAGADDERGLNNWTAKK